MMWYCSSTDCSTYAVPPCNFYSRLRTWGRDAEQHLRASGWLCRSAANRHSCRYPTESFRLCHLWYPCLRLATHELVQEKGSCGSTACPILSHYPILALRRNRLPVLRYSKETLTSQTFFVKLCDYKSIKQYWLKNVANEDTPTHTHTPWKRVMVTVVSGDVEWGWNLHMLLQCILEFNATSKNEVMSQEQSKKKQMENKCEREDCAVGTGPQALWAI